VLIHPQAFLDVALGKGSLRLAGFTGSTPEMLQGTRRDAEPEWLLGYCRGRHQSPLDANTV